MVDLIIVVDVQVFFGELGYFILVVLFDLIFCVVNKIILCFDGVGYDECMVKFILMYVVVFMVMLFGVW